VSRLEETLKKNLYNYIYIYTVGRTSIWYNANFADFSTYKSCRNL